MVRPIQQNFTDVVKTLYNQEKLHSLLGKVDWQGTVFNEPNVEHAYNNLVNTTCEIFNKLAPIKEFAHSKPKCFKIPWLSKDLLKAIKIKNRLFQKHKAFPFSPALKSKYKHQRNKVSTMTKKAKQSYYDEIIREQSSDPRKLWKTINEACGRSKPLSSNIDMIVDNSSEIKSDDNIAHSFNKFFTEIGPKLARAISTADNAVIEKDLYHFKQFNFDTIDSQTVFKELINLNEHKAEGLDNIVPKLVKDSARFLAEPLTHIFNLSILQKIVPSRMKVAKVLPIYKNKGHKHSLTNYRPISILPIYSKIYEKILNVQIQSHLENESVISTSQFGFQKKKGAQDALIKFVNNAFSSLNSSKMIIGIFIDFSKAFDTIDHKILLQKLKAMNFSQNSMALIENYLTNRYQQVSLTNTISPPLKITCGVPQGSILGPTLFLLYINDLFFYTQSFNTILFADDTNLFFETKSPDEDIETINKGLNIVNTWCSNNKLTLNIEKTNFIVIKNPQNKRTLNKTISMNNKNIVQTGNIKFLGVIIDSTLNWSSHIENLRTGLRSSLALIYLASTFLPEKTLILLYNSLINSKIVYCLAAWGNAPATYLNKILVMQKRVLRIIYHKPATAHSAPLFRKSNILPINQLYRQRLCLLAHTAFSLQINSKNDLIHHTRHSKFSLPYPAASSACGQRQVSYQVSDAWGGLPVYLREIRCAIRFKAALRQYLLDDLT